MEFEDFEPEIYADIKPVIAFQFSGTHSTGIFEQVQRILGDSYTLVEYHSPVMETGSGGSSISRSSGGSLTVDWVRHYLYGQPAVVIAICGVDGADGNTANLESSMKRLFEECHAVGRRMFVILNGMGSNEKRESLLGNLQISNNAIMITNTDTLQSIQQLSTFLTENTDRFYREEVKRFRKGLNVEPDDPAPVYAMLRTYFKIAFVELFMGENDSALKSFNNAYSFVVDHCQRLGTPVERATFLQSVRWMCDVIAFKLAWILISRGDKIDADEYIMGHITWFEQIFENEQDLCRWKSKLYDSMHRLLKAASTVSFRASDQKHFGYYGYVAAKNAMILEKDTISIEPIYVERVLALLTSSYDAYQRLGYTRTVIMIGRLIASQYLLLHNYEHALQTLIRLRKALRCLAWRALLGDILMEMMNIYKRYISDPKSLFECYWEYSTLFPEAVLDDFDGQIATMTSSLHGDRMIIDMSMTTPSMIKLAARYEQSSSTVGSLVRVHLMLCNMSPLVLSLAAFTIRFTNSSVPDMIISALKEGGVLPGSILGDDVLPGSIIELNEALMTALHGELSIESITIDLEDIPIRLFFPVNSLSINDSACSASWSDITTNWTFLRKLETFTEASQSILINPIIPSIACTIDQPQTMLPGEKCPLGISLDNQTPYFISCTIHFSGAIHDVWMHPPDDNSLPIMLAEYRSSLVCPPNTVTVSVLYISRSIVESFALRVDCHSVFTEAALQQSPNLLSVDSISQISDITIHMSRPFDTNIELVPLPTKAALSSPTGKRQVLIQYLAYVTVTATLPSTVILQEWDLSLVGSSMTFACLFPQPDYEEEEGSIDLECGESYRFLFLICAPPEYAPEETMWQPVFSLTWSYRDVPRPYLYQYDMPHISIFSKAIFIVPGSAKEHHQGRASRVAWRVWNMSDSLHDVVLKVDPGEDYIYMGRKQLRCHIMPLSMTEVLGTIIPLRPGQLQLPMLSLRSSNHTEAIVYETLSRPPIFVQP